MAKEDKNKTVELEQGYNGVTVIGKAKEYSIGIYEVKKKITDDNGDEREIVSAYISGRLVTDVNGSAVNNWIRFNKHRNDGEKNQMFDNICTAFGIDCGYDESKGQATYNFKAVNGITPSIKSEFILRRVDEDKDTQTVTSIAGNVENATMCKVKGTIGRNTMLNKDKSNVVVAKRINVTAIEKNVNEDERATFAVDGFIENIIKRTDANGDETGELDVSFVIPAYNNVDVLTFRVPAKWQVEDITLTSEEFYEWAIEAVTVDSYSMVKIMGNITTISTGRQPKKSSRAFGQQVELNSGFTRTEWQISGGELPDTEQIVDAQALKDIMTEWGVFLDAEYKRLKDRDANGGVPNSDKPQGQGVKGKINKKDLPF